MMKNMNGLSLKKLCGATIAIGRSMYSSPVCVAYSDWSLHQRNVREIRSEGGIGIPVIQESGIYF